MSALCNITCVVCTFYLVFTTIFGEEENDEFFTGKVHYGVSREEGEDKIGNHPITYDKDLNIIIKILAKPNAQRNLIGVCTKVERLGLRIAAPAKDGLANKEMLKFLARVLGIRKSALSIIEGVKSKMKTIKVEKGILTVKEVLEKLTLTNAVG